MNEQPVQLPGNNFPTIADDQVIPDICWHGCRAHVNRIVCEKREKYGYRYGQQ